MKGYWAWPGTLTTAGTVIIPVRGPKGLGVLSTVAAAYFVPDTVQKVLQALGAPVGPWGP